MLILYFIFITKLYISSSTIYKNNNIYILGTDKKTYNETEYTAYPLIVSIHYIGNHHTFYTLGLNIKRKKKENYSAEYFNIFVKINLSLNGVYSQPFYKYIV